jgi:hypothetical protein
MQPQILTEIQQNKANTFQSKGNLVYEVLITLPKPVFKSFKGFIGFNMAEKKKYANAKCKTSIFNPYSFQVHIT